MKPDKILLGHGSGGKLSHRLISDIFLPYFSDKTPNNMDDAAVLPFHTDSVVFSTDSYVVDPIEFPGGDIGKIAVCGTVNDISMMGAKPLFLSAGFIIEEGLPVPVLERILSSMRTAADEADVRVVTGDTKVVPHGAADKLFINTAGVGIPLSEHIPSGCRAEAGDLVIINGPIAEHGIAVLAKREGLEMDLSLETDSAPLNNLVEMIMGVSDKIHVLRDPTRGGVATTLNEIAGQSGVAIRIDEQKIPVSAEVSAACEILGLDPLYIANEGKLIVICPADEGDRVVATMRKHKYGHNSCIIGTVVAQPAGKVFVRTAIGGQRLIDMLAGEQLPRIC
jgi:hydrogenase expression/formation protein HypE